jgi:UDP-N-acetylmuramoyl-tripeptide--D-alanyl-D-alanine ligase
MKLYFGDNGSISIDTAAFGAASSDGCVRILGITTDSRKVKPGDMFAAFRGEHVDGNDYVAQALEAGASAVLCERAPDIVDGRIVIVPDTQEALGKLANAYRRHLCPRHVVGVTGSVGKTTTKQLIYSALAQKYRSHKTEGNYNNQIGLPLSVLAMPQSTEAAVFELGMSARGEISNLSKIVEPDIAVITCIGTSHIEHLGSRENIRDAKLEIRDGMRPGGTLILNGDEPLLADIAGAVYVSAANKNADYYYTQTAQDADGVTFDIEYDGKAARGIYVPSPGGHVVADAALAFAAATCAGVDEESIRRGFSEFAPTGMRQRIEKRGGMTIIADCYNASPESMKAALTVLTATSALNGGRAVAVLGDMLELGAFSERFHYEVGEEAARLGVDLLFAFGPNSAATAQGARRADMDSDRIFYNPDTSDPQTTVRSLQAELKSGDTVLFKASRGTAIERVMNELKL